MTFLDRNAQDPQRLRRNAQRLRAGAATSSIRVTAPLANTGSIALTLAAAGGLQTTGGLGLKLDPAGALGLTASGVKAVPDGTTLEIGSNTLRVKDLGVSTGKLADLAVTTAKLAANAVTPGKMQLATNGGLGDSTGLIVLGPRIVTADPITPTDGEGWYNSTAKDFRLYENGLTVGQGGKLYSLTTNSNTITNTTTLTAFSPNIVIPANWLVAGKVIVIKLSGFYAATGSPTLTLDFFFNGLASGIDGAAFTCGASGRFYAEVMLTIRSVGASGSHSPGGYLVAENAAGNVFQTLGQVSPPAVNTTVANTLNAAAQWSAANAANQATLTQFVVEVKG